MASSTFAPLSAQIARPAHSAAPARLVGALHSAWRWLRREAQIKSTIHTLSALNDHTLRDIGLERDEISRAVRGQTGAN